MVVDLGVIEYSEFLTVQREFLKKRKLGEIDDSIIIAEHKPVFTIGRSGTKDNLLVNETELTRQGINIFFVDRGGDITFHGPGQLMAYPIIDLKRKRRDLHHYLRTLECGIISFLKTYEVNGECLDGKTGVWVASMKIASIGVAASDWITYHGLSININVDLEFFSMIYPCGMRNIKITSLSKTLGHALDMQDAKRRLAAQLIGHFTVMGDNIGYRPSTVMA